MTLVQVFQILFESEACGVKWRHFYNKVANNYDIATEMEIILGQ